MQKHPQAHGKVLSLCVRSTVVSLSCISKQLALITQGGQQLAVSALNSLA